MAAPTIFEDVAEGFALEGQLFAGKKFWVAQRVPIRNRLLDDIKANGGEVVLLEKKADYMIADHIRRDCPPGSTSYTFIQESIDKGKLQDPEDHIAGPPLGEAREVGALHRPARGGRAAYTADEDRILYKWVRDCEAVGGLAGGNEIYKQLEAKYPRHTWQSWRDRYVKQLRYRPASSFNIPDNAPPSPPPDAPAPRAAPATAAARQKQAPRKVSGQGITKDGKAEVKPDYTLEQLKETFTSEDWEELYAFVEIIDALKGRKDYDEAWEKWANAQDNQTVDQWRQYYEKVVQPQWKRDPEWKREKIRKKVEDRHQAASSQKTNEEAEAEAEAEAEVVGDAPAINESSAAAQELTEEEPIEEEPIEEEPIEEEPIEEEPIEEEPIEEEPIEEEPIEEEPIEEEPIEEEPTEVNDTQDVLFEQELESRRIGSDTAAAAYFFYAREQKWSTWNAQSDLNHTQLHELLTSQWEALSDKAKAPYMAKHQATQKQSQAEASKLTSDMKLMSSSTAQYESPRRISSLYQNILKRLRGDELDTEENEEQDRSEQPPPIKRQRSNSPASDQQPQNKVIVGTHKQPVEIFSSESPESQDTEEGQINDQIRQDIEQTQRDDEIVLDSDLDDADKEVESVESEDFVDIGRLPRPLEALEDPSEDDLPSNTPTPRASRPKATNFDTQAILSSPSQDIVTTRLPRPAGLTQDPYTQPDLRSSSLAPHPESDASTTQSLQEFRRSLNDEDSVQQPLHAVSRPLSLSPTPSNSSDTSGDPDEPLSASEMDAFFTEQNAQGFSDDFIISALKRTRCRPSLAEVVLEAWGQGHTLPFQRGIWSIQDDEAVESGDGVALAKLERKHTLDGWGGITERLRFLEGYRSR